MKSVMCNGNIGDILSGPYIRGLYIDGSGIMVKERSCFFIILVGICITLILTGCSSKSVTGLSEEMDKITLEVVTKSELPEAIVYSIKLNNGSSFLIKQNNVYVS